MGFLRAEGISLAFGARDILLDVSFSLDSDSRVALSGANGSGKTTFLNILAGKIAPDGGKISLSQDCRIAYLPQSGVVLGSGNVFDEAEKAFSFVEPWLKEQENLGDSLQKEQNPRVQEKYLLRLDQINQSLDQVGYWSREARIQAVLQGLGFSSKDVTRPVQEFSGGWQMRVGLARALLQEPDILLLDEPTNYLDLEAKAWLENFLKGFPGGVLVVSHDRGFLDRVVRSVAEIFLGDLTIYQGNFTQYETQRREEVNALLKAYAQQQADISKNEEFINRFRAKASKASSVQSRIRMLEKMERIEVPENLVPMQFSFPPAPHCGHKVLELVDLSKSYGSQKVLTNLNLTLTRGEKLVVTGPNGAGKSTLLRLLSGEDSPTLGQVIWGAGVKTAYFSQDHEKKLNPKNTVLEEVESLAPTALIPRIRDLLGAFLFRGDSVGKPVNVLSGGEKNRISLIKLLLEPANVLILDEPTNHLDMASKDVLLEALQKFHGTVIFVSHDSYFIQGLATKVLDLSGVQPWLYPGTWNDFMEQKARIIETEVLSSPLASMKGPSDSQMAREDQKRKQALIKRLEKEEQSLLETLDGHESKIQEYQELLSSPEVYSDGVLTKKYTEALNRAIKARDETLSAWETVANELENQRNVCQ